MVYFFGEFSCERPSKPLFASRSMRLQKPTYIWTSECRPNEQVMNNANAPENQTLQYSWERSIDNIIYSSPTNVPIEETPLHSHSKGKVNRSPNAVNPSLTPKQITTTIRTLIIMFDNEYIRSRYRQTFPMTQRLTSDKRVTQSPSWTFKILWWKGMTDYARKYPNDW